MTVSCISAFALLSATVQSRGTAPKLKVVAIIDTGLDLKDPRFQHVLCKSGHANATNEPMDDYEGHGTHVLGTIVENAPSSGWCAVIIKNWTENNTGKQNIKATAAAFQHLLTIRPDYVNYSGGGDGYSQEEYNIITSLPNTKFVFSIGNNGLNLSLPDANYYPAEYHAKNITPVGSIDRNGQRSSFSNYGLSYVRWEMGRNVLSTLPGMKKGYLTGTSMAAAIATGKILSDDLKK